MAMQMHLLSSHVAHPYRSGDTGPFGFVPKPMIGVPRETWRLLKVSAALQYLSEYHGDDTASAMDIAFFLFSGWNISGSSSVELLLQDQVTSTLCPKLVELFTSLLIGGTVNDPDMKVGVTLIDHCSSSEPVAGLARSVELLSAAVASGQVPIAATRTHDSLKFLSAHQDKWIAGLTSLPLPVHRIMYASWLLHDVLRNHASLVPWRGTEARKITAGNAAKARAVGRALGLAVRHGVDLSSLRLSPSFVRLLHPRFRFNARSTRELIEWLGAPDEDELCTFLRITLGMQDAIGIGGFEMYSSAAWLSRFSGNTI